MLIAPFQTGLDTDLEPWLAPDDSFIKAVNVHVHHGYIQKRSGLELFGTLPSADRVMGLYRFIQADGGQEHLAFDTTRAYRFDAPTHAYVTLDAAAIMSGSDTDYIWAVNWDSSDIENRLYFTNGKAFDGASLDGIRYYNGLGGNVTVSFVPDLNTAMTRKLYGAKLLFVLNSRLIALFTYEDDGVSTTTHHQRARWCAVQGPSNWNDEVAGGGGFVDCPTGDQIISARAIQNQIIVQFTDSVWTLRPVPDPALPFRWDKINNFRACNGKMATTAYDRYVVAVGTRGITATDGVETRRIDNRIEDFSNDEINFGQFGKVFCERSYSNRRWWTLYASDVNDENDAVLIYDDESHAFTTYDLALNCLGYGTITFDYGLDDFTVANNLDFDLMQVGDNTLQDYFYIDTHEIFLGGNTSGDVYILEKNSSDEGTAISAEIESTQWNPFRKEGKEALLSFIDFYIDTDPETTYLIEFFKDDNLNPYASQRLDSLPNLGFLVSIIGATQANPVQVNVPNHGLSTGDQVFVYGVEGMEDLNDGPYTITVVDSNFVTLNGVDSTAFGVYTTGGAFYERQFYRTKVWKRAFSGGIGYEHRIRITSSGTEDPFRIHAFKPNFKPRGKRTINP